MARDIIHEPVKKAIENAGWTVTTDRVIIYRALLKTLLSQHAERMSRRPQPETEIEVIFDEERDHYMLLRLLPKRAMKRLRSKLRRFCGHRCYLNFIKL